jgi:hypothetical protein
LRQSSVLASAAVLFSLAVLTAAQSPQSPPPAPGGAPPRERSHPAPTNLKVLSKNLTGDQVHDIMEGWESQLGVHCRTCHAENPKDIGPNGRPRLNYADDSKPEKNTARLMFKMTEDINVNYVSKVENSGEPVTCGTCHRGHLGPEPFVPEEEHRESQPNQKPPLPK